MNGGVVERALCGGCTAVWIAVCMKENEARSTSLDRDGSSLLAALQTLVICARLSLPSSVIYLVRYPCVDLCAVIPNSVCCVLPSSVVSS